MLIDNGKMFCSCGRDTSAFIHYCDLFPSCDRCVFWLSENLEFPKEFNGMVLNCGTFLFLKDEYDFCEDK